MAVEIKGSGKWFVSFFNSETIKDFDSREEAMAAAEKYVGNNRYTKPFPGEDTYIYGPGDGSTSCMVREHLDFETGKTAQ